MIITQQELTEQGSNLLRLKFMSNSIGISVDRVRK